MENASSVDALTHLFTSKKDLVIQFLYPVLSLELKMAVLPLVNKQIRESVTVKTRDLQYYNFVASEVVIYADEMTADHNQKLASLKSTSEWQTARIIITSAQFITKLKPFMTLRGSSAKAK